MISLLDNNRDFIQLIIEKYGCLPTYMHSMTIGGAETAAALLIAKFNEVDPKLNYYSHKKKIKQSNDDEININKITSRQLTIVQKWFFWSEGKPLNSVNDDEIIDSLCKLTNSYYFH